MKKLLTKVVTLILVATFTLSCAGRRYANTGTSSDRTGYNGATNGTGEPPKGTAHKVRY